jgi:hypothetical protein
MSTPTPLCRDGSDGRNPLLVSPNERGPSCYELRDTRLPPPPDRSSDAHGMSASGRCALARMASTVCTTQNDPAGGRLLPPVVAWYVVKLACERPDVVGRSLSPWESAALARQLVRDGGVAAILPQTVQRMLMHHQLKPGRHHLWLSPQGPWEAVFAAQVQELVTLYPRPGGYGTWCCAWPSKPVASHGRAQPPPWPPNRVTPSGSNRVPPPGSPAPLGRF